MEIFEPIKIPNLPIVHQSQLLPYIEGHGKGISHVALNFRKKSQDFN